MPVSSQGHDVLTRAVEALRRGLGDRLVAVVLFGSRARGEAADGSDWDLLVVAKDLPTSPLERHFLLKKLLPAGCEGVSLLTREPQEFEDHLSSLYLDIALDGKVLYDPTGLIRRRLEALRKMVEDLGLYRERTEAGLEWRWKASPAGPWAHPWKK